MKPMRREPRALEVAIWVGLVVVLVSIVRVVFG